MYLVIPSAYVGMRTREIDNVKVAHLGSAKLEVRRFKMRERERERERERDHLSKLQAENSSTSAARRLS